MERIKKRMRLFIAVSLPEQVKDKVAQFIEKTRKDFFQMESFSGKIKWLKKENMHITVKFLGETGVGLGKIKSALGLSAGGISPDKVEFNRSGIFTQKRPSILWLGSSRQSKSLQELYQKTNLHFAPLGFETDEREFIPHLTLGRVNEGRVDRKTVEKFLIQKVEPFNVEIDMVSLFESELSQLGARHNIIYNAEFKD